LPLFEETGLRLEHVTDKGIVTWTVDNSHSGGMYLFLGELPEDYRYETPRQTDEGILDWKPISWILDERNQGLATNIPKFMPLMLGDEKSYDHQCIFQNGQLMEVNSVAMEIIKRK
jgi:8-oxo-dGTP diphosphatase